MVTLTVTLMGALVTFQKKFLVSTCHHHANQLLRISIDYQSSIALHDPIPDLSLAVSHCVVGVPTTNRPEAF